jgi:putative transposase
VARLQAKEIKISWSGRKRCYDNILVERLWRTLKYEEVYLRAYSDGWEAEISLARFLMEVLPCKAPQLPGRQNSPRGLY